MAIPDPNDFLDHVSELDFCGRVHALFFALWDHSDMELAFGEFLGTVYGVNKIKSSKSSKNFKFTVQTSHKQLHVLFIFCMFAIFVGLSKRK